MLRRILCVAIAGLCATVAQSAVVIDLAERDGVVVATYSGSIALDDLVPSRFGGCGPARFFIDPDGGSGRGAIGFENDCDGTAFLAGHDLPVFGTGSGDSFRPNFGGGNDARGDTFALLRSGDLVLPRGYVSGSPIAGSFTTALASFATLGITRGSTFATTLSNGETVTLNVVAPPPSPIPLPASLPLLAIGLGVLLMRGRPPR